MRRRSTLRVLLSCNRKDFAHFSSQECDTPCQLCPACLIAGVFRDWFSPLSAYRTQAEAAEKAVPAVSGPAPTAAPAQVDNDAGETYPAGLKGDGSKGEGGGSGGDGAGSSSDVSSSTSGAAPCSSQEGGRACGTEEEACFSSTGEAGRERARGGPSTAGREQGHDSRQLARPTGTGSS